MQPSGRSDVASINCQSDAALSGKRTHFERTNVKITRRQDECVCGSQFLRLRPQMEKLE